MARNTSRAKVEEEIASLRDLPRTALIESWVAHYKSPPPKGMSRALLVRAVAFRIQAGQWGGLKPKAFHRLQKAMRGLAPEVQTPKQPPRQFLKPGTRLLREWNGQAHQVEVTDVGFLWNGRQYGSLSSVARAITGARWSGPRFFRLTRRRSS